MNNKDLKALVEQMRTRADEYGFSTEREVLLSFADDLERALESGSTDEPVSSSEGAIDHAAALEWALTVVGNADTARRNPGILKMDATQVNAARAYLDEIAACEAALAREEELKRQLASYPHPQAEGRLEAVAYEEADPQERVADAIYRELLMNAAPGTMPTSHDFARCALDALARGPYSHPPSLLGMVPEGWVLWQLVCREAADIRPWEAAIEHKVTGKNHHGTGPTPELAVKDAAEKVTK